MIFEGYQDFGEEAQPLGRSWLKVGVLALGFLALCAWAALAQTAGPDVPPPGFGVANPAVTDDNIHSTICVPGYSKKVRPPVSYTNALKRKLLAAALADPSSGYTDRVISHYELDHFWPIEDGGDPRDPGNLWLEHWDGPWGAHTKDLVENAIHVEICAGRLSLADAHAALRADWRVLGCHYLSRLPCPP